MTGDGERHIIVNRIRHWCRIDGAGLSEVPVIAIHGGPGGNHYVFERTIVPHLARAMTVVSYEQRGCGRSDAPASADEYSIPLLISDLDELRSNLGFDRVMLLGYSFGSDLALEYALAHPARVVRMVLQAPRATTGLSEAAEVQLRGFVAAASTDVRDAIRTIVDSDQAAEVKLSEIWKAADTATMDALLFEDPKIAGRNRALWRESGLRNTGLMERALARHAGGRAPLRNRLAGLDIPSLVVVGRHDRNVGVGQSSEVARLLPKARLQVFERSAHFPDLEEPEEFLRVVVPFLTGD